MSTDAGLLQHAFRASAAYEFVHFRRFAGGEVEVADDLSRDADMRGMLRPRGPNALGVKTATRGLAALFRALTVPGPLPKRLRQSDADETAREVARLVLDGILEVERDGRFVSGAEAEHLLPPSPDVGIAANDRLARLSREAIRYGEALEIDDPGSLSARIYFYNRVPVAPRWAHRLTTPDSIIEFLGLTSGGETRTLLDRHWSLVRPEEAQGWLMCVPREKQRARYGDATVDKLYVSPTVPALPDVLRVVVSTLAAHGPTTFKIGSDIHSLFSPDKLVVYFFEPGLLDVVADELRRVLDGTAAHGVPFTASLESQGLLSRGVDPPHRTKTLSWRETESWRLWVTNRLAVYLLTAKATRSSVTAISAADFAIARLRLDGVDTSTWSPVATDWLADQTPVGP